MKLNVKKFAPVRGENDSEPAEYVPVNPTKAPRVKLPQLTPAEASWAYAVIECVTGTQDRKSEERIRQSLFRKLREIANSRKVRR